MRIWQSMDRGIGNLRGVIEGISMMISWGSGCLLLRSAQKILGSICLLTQLVISSSGLCQRGLDILDFFIFLAVIPAELDILFFFMLGSFVHVLVDRTDLSV